MAHSKPEQTDPTHSKSQKAKEQAPWPAVDGEPCGRRGPILAYEVSELWDFLLVRSKMNSERLLSFVLVAG